MSIKREFVWLTKQIDLLQQCRDSGITQEFTELATRLYWKLRNKRDKLVKDTEHGVII